MPLEQETCRYDADLSPPLLQAGRILFQRYRLERLLGRGGMGVVWLAHDEKLDRHVALKLLPDVLFRDPAARDDLKRETRRSLDLTHPHIVRIHDFIEDEETAAIVMEYVDGPNLSQLRVDRPSRIFEVDDLKMWTAALCGALEYAHDAGRCVHRDLKPSNLMVSARGVLKIADFGIACGLHHTAARVSAWASTGGTLGYMSPQQLLGELAAPSDDLYSVGATLYELLTGKPPFFSGDIATQIREVPAENIAARRGQFGLPGAVVPAAWEETIAACLAKEPQNRPRSAREVARLLGLPLATGTEIAPPLHDELAPTICIPREKLAPWPAIARTRRYVRTAAKFVARHRWPLITALAVIAALVPWISGVRPGPPAAAPAVSGMPTAASLRPPAETNPAPAPAPAPLPAASPADRSFLAETPIPGFVPAAQPAPAALEPPQIEILTEPRGIPFQLFASASETPDAKVVFEGETPATVTQLPPGAYRVSFLTPGLPPRAVSIEIPEQGTATFRQDFPTGTVNITSQPAGAEIFSGARSLGLTPMETTLLAGKHEFGARWQGRDARLRTIQLKADGHETVAFDFSPSSAARSKTRRSREKPDASLWDKMGRTINKVFTGDRR